LNEDEKVAEISARRNRIEKLLRVTIRNTLHASYGKKKATEVVLAAIPEKRRESLKSLTVDALLARDGSPLFLLELISIVKREWAALQNVFEIDKTKLEVMLEEVNASGRPDAHARYLKDDDFMQLRLYFKKLESVLEDWAQ
jgi:hypothetical protein